MKTRIINNLQLCFLIERFWWQDEFSPFRSIFKIISTWQRSEPFNKVRAWYYANQFQNETKLNHAYLVLFLETITIHVSFTKSKRNMQTVNSQGLKAQTSWGDCKFNAESILDAAPAEWNGEMRPSMCALGRYNCK